MEISAGEKIQRLRTTEAPITGGTDKKHEVAGHTCTPRTQDAETGGFQVQGQSRMHRNFKGNLDIVTHYFKKSGRYT